MEPKPIENKVMWALFSPDNEIQLGLMAYTKKDLKTEIIPLASYHSMTWRELIHRGYYFQKVAVDIIPIQ